MKNDEGNEYYDINQCIIKNNDSIKFGIVERERER